MTTWYDEVKSKGICPCCGSDLHPEEEVDDNTKRVRCTVCAYEISLVTEVDAT